MSRSCADIRDAIRDGRDATAPEHIAHLARCPACTALVEASGLFRDALEDTTAPDLAPALDRVFSGVRARIEADAESPLGALRSRSTPARILLAVLAVGLVIIPAALLILREDFSVYPRGRMVLVVASMTAALLMTIAAALRPAHWPTLTPEKVNALAGGVLLLELVLSVLPAAHVSGSHSSLGIGRELLPFAMPCFYFGLLFGFPVYVVLRLLDNGVSRLAGLLAASSAGLAANLALHMHCPMTHPEHILVGHFTVALAFVGSFGLASSSMSRRRSSPSAGKFETHRR